MSIKHEIIHQFRKFICLVDILSVFLVHENFPEYRVLIQEDLKVEELIFTLHSLMTGTDSFYEVYFKRNKSLNKQEALEVPILKESNFLYGFQTNIMKFLSNYAFKNEKLKSYMNSNPLIFYYFLNHLKLDKCNPFKKEWSVLFIKAVTEESTSIQKLIGDLQPDFIDPLLKDYILMKDKIKYVNKEELNKYKDNLNK